VTIEEAMQMLAKAWLEAPRKSLGHTSDGRSRGDLVKCPACKHMILLTRPDATEHLTHHREVASRMPFRFWLDLAPITGLLPVALWGADFALAKKGAESVAAAPGMRPAVIRAMEFIRDHRALLTRAGILQTKRSSSGGDFVLLPEEEWLALCSMSSQEDFGVVAVQHYTQQALLRSPTARRPAALLH
jgi:hypothetical protein